MYTDQDILTSLDKAKECMEQVTTLYGTISADPRTKGSRAECFLPDTGATLNIIGLEVAKDNGLKITRLTKPRRIAKCSVLKNHNPISSYISIKHVIYTFDNHMIYPVCVLTISHDKTSSCLDCILSPTCLYFSRSTNSIFYTLYNRRVIIAKDNYNSSN